ncbi:glycosyltransferase family 2 protein [Butyrivibrio sp. YAB3001]|uniref:glycosyltransferase family 2 protein n=1 Tax=Butyrivibrio sp. YAB3001 TaxID=1520812 RepID=UPI0008F68B82|nr:glycosyltransferase family 2 protein [Butyrivibrio sp. YAB3001]SFC17257.1 Glycosyl transferase family 2 [Butyrivibrio sp. YAB3001]
MKDKITVIIPAYNIESLITKCVESVVKQDYPADLLEIIVVDDGSTDKTGQIIDELSNKYSNVHAYHKDNGGSSSARNLGLLHATGDYIGFVDSDDYVDPRMYSVLMSAAVSNEADMVQISRDEIDEDGNKLPDVVIPPIEPVTIKPKDHLRKLLMHTGDASFCTKLVKRSLFTDDMLFPEGELNEDFYLMIHMLERVNKLVILPQQYYHVFYRTGSNSRRKKEDKDYFPSVFTDIVRNSDVALELVKKSFPELEDIAKRFGFVQRLDYLLHIPVSKMTRDNDFYRSVVSYNRKNIIGIIKNSYLTKKQKAYLLILAIAPRSVRALHAKIRGL